MLITNHFISTDRTFISYLSSLKRIGLNPSPLDIKKSKKFLNFVEPIQDISSKTKTFEAILTLQESTSIEFFYFGNFEDEGEFHGQAVLDVRKGIGRLIE